MWALPPEYISPRILSYLQDIIIGTTGRGLKDGLSQKRWTIVTLPSVLSAVCIAQN